VTASRHQAVHAPATGGSATDAPSPPVASDRGDVRWLEELFRANSSGVYTIARRVLHNDADSEDVTQASFIRAFVARSSLRDADRARPWLLRIAYREAVAVLRRRRDLPTDPAVLPLRHDTGPGPEDCLLAADVAGRVRRAVDALPPALAAAVILRDLQGLPMTEVAEVLGTGLSAAKMRVHRARTLLKVALHADDRVA